WASVQRGGSAAEGELPPRDRRGQPPSQVSAVALEVVAELNHVVAVGLGKVRGDSNGRVRTDPGDTVYGPEHGDVEASDVEAGKPARELIQIGPGDAELVRGFGPVTPGRDGVVIAVDAEAHFRH